jgi:hypothetical protein
MTSEDLWRVAVDEDEPELDGDQLGRPHRPPPIDVHRFHDEAERDFDLKQRAKCWQRIERSKVIDHATSSESSTKDQSVEEAWKRVIVVCGAGLGKTTNLEWLEYRLNSLTTRTYLPLLLEVRALRQLIPEDAQEASKENALAEILQRLEKQPGLKLIQGNPDLRKRGLERMLIAGRVIWLLDSLDQANPTPGEKDVQAIVRLCSGPWKECPVWVTGRPYAFRQASSALRSVDGGAWKFLRIGLLDEPEARQLVETGGRPLQVVTPP